MINRKVPAIRIGKLTKQGISVPPWASFIATDLDGLVFAYEYRPHYDNDTSSWVNGEFARQSVFIGANTTVSTSADAFLSLRKVDRRPSTITRLRHFIAGIDL